MANKTKLELTWIGKENRPRLEPRILIEDPENSYHAPFRVTENDLFDNRLIFGDNLLALKALEQEFTGKIKCIYIDPPYNTGAALTHYEDGVEHSIWLSLIKDRLELLHRLLCPDGTFFCSIDSNELFYLGILLDEIFGRDNRIETFVWKKSYGGGAKSRYVVNLHEYVLCYAKDIALTGNFFLPPDQKTIKYYKYKDRHFEQRGPYRLQPLATTSMDERPNLRYPIISPEGTEIWPQKQWQWSDDRVKEALRNDEIVITNKNGKYTVSYKQYLRDPDGKERMAKPYSIIDGYYTQHGTYESMDVFGLQNKFAFPKPEGLIWYLIACCTESGDWVLDSFAGSGTTGAVVHKMGRRWIMVELGEHCHTHIIPRLKKVIDGSDKGGITEAVGWKGGGGFRYYRLAPSLLEKDQFGNWIISKKYNPTMLAEAICKLEGFTYAPSDEIYWQHGHSTENDFIYVTTQTLTREQFQRLSDEVGETRSLLVMCSAFRVKNLDDFPNITVKKIPKAVMNRCEWGKDDYSLEIKNLQVREMEPAEDQSVLPLALGGKTNHNSKQTTLFDLAGVKGGKKND